MELQRRRHGSENNRRLLFGPLGEDHVMSSAQRANRPTSDSPVGALKRDVRPATFPIGSGYYDPDSSSFDDDIVTVGTAFQSDSLDSDPTETRELVTA
jgi:hypothetical protein